MVWQRGRSYSQDLRSRVLALEGLSARQAAERFEVSVSYVIKARQRRNRTGEVRAPCRGISPAGADPAYGRRFRRTLRGTLDHAGRSAGLARC